MRFSLKLSLVIAFAVVVFLGIGFLMENKASPSLLENSTTFVQDGEEINVLPSVLERISWSGIFAGSFLSLIMMFLLNLLGITLGMSQFNPENRYDSGDVALQRERCARRCVIHRI